MDRSHDYHRPVLLKESVDALGIRDDGTYVDVTFGGGGHSWEILKRIGEEGKLIAFDRDADAHHNKIEDSRLLLIRSDFKFIESVFAEGEIGEVSGILADLGISSHHVDTPDRGFSFRFDRPLDMRMDQDAELSAVDVVNDYSESELVRIFREYGEIRNAVGLARSVTQYRAGRPILNTQDLKDVVAESIAAKSLSRILPLVYQAIRIEVNGELDALRALLLAGNELVASGGRMSIISYHSLEDRMVKNFFRYGNLEKVITRKAIKPTDEEIEINPRARSARLRVAEKI
ncbi:UNVERIFIED_CONTAM: hypothetical protein GTU68_057401 [Idotea baltica]|nr:hypothetical protein [Idotea baltica]